MWGFKKNGDFLKVKSKLIENSVVLFEGAGIESLKKIDELLR